MRYVQQSFSDFAIIYFISIVIIGSFFLLNLTLAVLMSEYNEKVEEQKKLKEAEIAREKKSTLLYLTSMHPQANDLEKKAKSPFQNHKKHRKVKKSKGISFNKYKSNALCSIAAFDMFSYHFRIIYLYQQTPYVLICYLAFEYQ